MYYKTINAITFFRKKA